MPDTVIIRNRLRLMREKAGYPTQSALADELEVRQTTISEIEKDGNFVSRDMLASLCRILRCDVGDLFFAERVL